MRRLDPDHSPHAEDIDDGSADDQLGNLIDKAYVLAPQHDPRDCVQQPRDDEGDQRGGDQERPKRDVGSHGHIGQGRADHESEQCGADRKHDRVANHHPDAAELVGAFKGVEGEGPILHEGPV